MVLPEVVFNKDLFAGCVHQRGTVFSWGLLWKRLVVRELVAVGKRWFWAAGSEFATVVRGGAAGSELAAAGFEFMRLCEVAEFAGCGLRFRSGGLPDLPPTLAPQTQSRASANNIAQ